MKRLFDEDLQELREGLLKMGREVEAMLADACGVMDTRDPRVSDQVVARDARVDRMEREVDSHSHAILVRRRHTREAANRQAKMARPCEVRRVGGFGHLPDKREPGSLGGRCL